jgi:hypothetical protein
MKQTGPTVLATGIALLGDGFWASAARSGVTGMMLLARPPNPTKVFATRPPLVDWLVQSSSAISREGLLGALAGVDARLRQLPARPG